MSADIQRWVVEYFFLDELSLLLLTHLSFEKVEGGVGLLDFDGSALSLLLLEEGTEIFIFAIVLATLHLNLTINLFRSYRLL